MAQSRAGRLAPVVEMAEKAEKTAVQRLGNFQGQVSLAESKLADLEAFRLDYQEQWIVRGSGGVSGQWLLGYQGFLAQLGTAIDQQRPMTKEALARIPGLGPAKIARFGDDILAVVRRQSSQPVRD